MAQVKVLKKNDFTQVENRLIQNPDLSLKAKGLLIYMLSVPDDWDYSISGLSVKCKEGKSSIRSAIAELMEHGYITRSIARSENGSFDGYEYVVYETPQPSPENRTTDSPSCENPTSENPTSENRTQQIYNKTNKNKTNTPYSPPAGDAPSEDAKPADKPQSQPKPKRSSRSKYNPSHAPNAFETFWAAYPRKDSRPAAVRAWDKLKPDRELCRTMYDALKRQCRSEQWAEADGKYIPMFSTWLNGGRWKDQGVDRSLLARPKAASGGWSDGPGVAS